MCSRNNELTREYRRNDLAPLLGITPSLSDEKISACVAQDSASLFDCIASFGLAEAAKTRDDVCVGVVGDTPSGGNDCREREWNWSASFVDEDIDPLMRMQNLISVGRQ